MASKLANIVTVILHPAILPTLGFLLLFNSGFYFSFINWEAKRMLLLVILFSTAIMPLLSMSVLALYPKFTLSFETSNQRILPLLFSSVFYYMGYFLLNRMNAYPIIKIIMIASVMVILALMLISLRWKISSHMAAIGGLMGVIIALSFRTGVYPVWSIISVILASGFLGSSLLLLEKNNL